MNQSLPQLFIFSHGFFQSILQLHNELHPRHRVLVNDPSSLPLLVVLGSDRFKQLLVQSRGLHQVLRILQVGGLLFLRGEQETFRQLHCSLEVCVLVLVQLPHQCLEELLLAGCEHLGLQVQASVLSLPLDRGELGQQVVALEGLVRVHVGEVGLQLVDSTE